MLCGRRNGKDQSARQREKGSMVAHDGRLAGLTATRAVVEVNGKVATAGNVLPKEAGASHKLCLSTRHQKWSLRLAATTGVKSLERHSQGGSGKSASLSTIVVLRLDQKAVVMLLSNIIKVVLATGLVVVVVVVVRPKMMHRQGQND